jgi:hypothetical protein
VAVDHPFFSPAGKSRKRSKNFAASADSIPRPGESGRKKEQNLENFSQFVSLVLSFIHQTNNSFI